MSTEETKTTTGRGRPMKDAPAPPSAGTIRPPTAGGGFKLNRVLRVTKPLLKGGDVKAVQAALIARGFGCGVDGANGIYNASTALAVRHFQSMNRLIVSGKVEKFTAAALGATWKEPPSGTNE